MNKILVADDERPLRMLISGTLKLGGFEVLEAENGIDALKSAEQQNPDLIILDVMMPGMTGYEVCKHIKSNPSLKDIKVLILSAKGNQTDKESAFGVHADYYLPKPFSPIELLSTVKGILNV